MKTFKDIREAKSSVAKSLFSKRVGKVSVSIKQEGNRFVVFVDNDKLDHYSSLNQAKKMGLEFAKEYTK